MTTNTLLEMLRKHLIPLPLVNGWINSRKPHQVLENATVLEMACNLLYFTLSLMYVGIVAMPKTFPHPYSASSVFGILTLLLLVRMVGSFQTSFSKNLNALRTTFDETWADFFKPRSQHLFQFRADEILTYHAALVKDREKKFGINSSEANAARINFEKAWKACREFSLADEKYNRYYEAADCVRLKV